MSAPSAREQYTLELTNRARLDPDGAYDRLVTDAPQNVTDSIDFFNVDLTILRQQFDALTAVAPLAWNGDLGNAAVKHSQEMIDADTQSHRLPGEATLGTRISNEGYNFSTVGENVYAFGDDAFQAHAAFFIDWGSTATGIQDPAGHRDNIMSDSFVEMGIGYLRELDAGTQVGTDVITHNFGDRFGYEAQLTGVVIDDNDGDRFYDIGEGEGGVTVQASGTAGTFTTQTWAAGGYNLVVPAGDYTVTFTQGAQTFSTTATVGTDNVKVDALIDDMTPLTTNGTQDSLYDVSRFYNASTGAHFYTANDTERDLVIADNDSFVYEGNAFDSNATPTTGEEVFRFYNTQTGVHFYTISESERDNVIATTPQFDYEGIGYYAFTTEATGREALYRFYVAETGTHFYTASESERDGIIDSLPQYDYEGIGYYVEVA